MRHSYAAFSMGWQKHDAKRDCPVVEGRTSSAKPVILIIIDGAEVLRYEYQMIQVFKVIL